MHPSTSVSPPQHIWQVLQARGLYRKSTDADAMIALVEKRGKPITAYIGFDPTANSFHAGHLVPLMTLIHWQRCGHRPIALLGGGTAMIGDPTGKNDMRKMLSLEQLQCNAEGLRQQLNNLLAFDGPQGAVLANNADWLLGLGYVEFLRDVGVHFSVNRMLTFETFRMRMEGGGLSFLEFNYPLLQAYDFWQLKQRYQCLVQFGGDDQWANIISGIDLVRRMGKTTVYGWTLPLLTTSGGKKMGKTERGALWLDANKTSPYEYYQYWLNVDDDNVGQCLRLLTFLPLEEIHALERLEGEKIRQAKAVLAHHTCALVHGQEEAEKAQKGARALFGGSHPGNNPKDLAHIPSSTAAKSSLKAGLGVLAALEQVGLTRSRGEARRLVRQGGVFVNGQRLENEEAVLTLADVQEGAILLGIGKKRRLRLLVC